MNQRDILAEQQTISIMLVVKSSYTAATASIYLTILYLCLGRYVRSREIEM